MSCRRHRLCAAFAASLALLAPAATVVAQPSNMAAMFGRPLYMGRLPAGVATVRVIGKSFADKKVGAPATLYAVGGERIEKIAESKTNDKSRAQFSKLVSGRIYFIEVVVDGKTLRTHPFSGPNQGGVRFLISTTVAAPPRPKPGTKASAAPSGGGDGGGGGMPPGHPGSSASGGDDGKPQKIKKGRSGAAQMLPLTDVEDGLVRVKVLLGNKATPVGKARVSVIVDGTPQRRRTDDKGQTSVKIDPAAKTVRIAVGHAGLSYRSRKLIPPKKGGVELSFTVYNRTTDASVLHFGAGSHILCGVGEKRLGFRQVLAIINPSDKLFNPGDKGLELPVPPNAERLSVSKEDKRFVTQRGNKLFITSPIPPGRLAVQYFFEMGYDDGVADVSQTMPLDTQRLVFIFTNATTPTVTGPSMVSRRVETMRGRQTVIYTLRATKRGEKLEITIGGLPQDKTRTTTIVAISLASVILIWGVLGAAAARRPERERKRESLLQELATLEAQRRRAMRDAGREHEATGRRGDGDSGESGERDGDDDDDDVTVSSDTGPLPREVVEALRARAEKAKKAEKAKAKAEAEADAAPSKAAASDEEKARLAKSALGAFDETKYQKRRAEIVAELRTLWGKDKEA